MEHRVTLIDLIRVSVVSDEQRLRDSFNSFLVPGDLDECWEWQGRRNREGYGAFTFSSGWKQGAHRVSFLLNHGWLPTVDENGKKFHVRHTCDNPPCVNPVHLLHGTAKQNYDDAVARGRHSGFAVLTPEDRSKNGRLAGQQRWIAGPKFTVTDLERCAGLSIRESAALLGCSTATVSRLRKEAAL